MLPVFMDYFIEVITDNNGHEAPLLLARRTFNLSATGPSDTLTAEVFTQWLFHSMANSI